MAGAGTPGDGAGAAGTGADSPVRARASDRSQSLASNASAIRSPELMRRNASIWACAASAGVSPTPPKSCPGRERATATRARWPCAASSGLTAVHDRGYAPKVRSSRSRTRLGSRVGRMSMGLRVGIRSTSRIRSAVALLRTTTSTTARPIRRVTRRASTAPQERKEPLQTARASRQVTRLPGVVRTSAVRSGILGKPRSTHRSLRVSRKASRSRVQESFLLPDRTFSGRREVSARSMAGRPELRRSFTHIRAVTG